jgi:hypothetical protein
MRSRTYFDSETVAKAKVPGTVFSFECPCRASNRGYGRYAAVKRCDAEAQKHYRGIYYSWGDARNFAYKRCVFDAGFPE